jgi:hypothetical protein
MISMLFVPDVYVQIHSKEHIAETVFQILVKEEDKQMEIVQLVIIVITSGVELHVMFVY